MTQPKSVNIREAAEFRVTDPRNAVKIMEDFSDDPAAKFDPISVVDAFEKTVKNFPNHKAMVTKDELTKQWNEITYKEYKDRVDKMAKVFIKLGLERHGTVAVLAFNCVEWFVSELAAIHAG
jgi:long-chain-fatty-acid--CoA ligase ACSBG